MNIGPQRAAPKSLAALRAELKQMHPNDIRDTTDANAVRDYFARKGYRPCDIPACNCGGFHGGLAEARLDEIRQAVREYGMGKTILALVEEAVADARRYKFLKDNCTLRWPGGFIMASPLFGVGTDNLDAAIDQEIGDA